MSTSPETMQNGFHPASVYSGFTDEARALLDSYVPVLVRASIIDPEGMREDQESILGLGGVIAVVDLRPIMESEWGKPTATIVDGLREWFEKGREAWCKTYLPDVSQSARHCVLLFTVVPLHRLKESRPSSSKNCETILQVLEAWDEKGTWQAPAGTNSGELACG